MNYERTHEVKIDECYFANVVSGRKRFEIRYDDRDYQVGDWLILCCDRTTRGYPQRGLLVKLSTNPHTNRRTGTAFLALPLENKNDRRTKERRDDGSRKDSIVHRRA